MDIVWFLIIGALAGWIAGELTRGYGFGLFGNIIVGMIGSLVGGFFFDIFGIGVDTFFPRLIVSVIGAVVFLFILSLLGARTPHRM